MLTETVCLVLGLLIVALLIITFLLVLWAFIRLSDLRVTMNQLENDSERIEANLSTVAEATTTEINNMRQRLEFLEGSEFED